MEVCVDSVQSALNAERGGEYLIFSVSEFASDSVWMKVGSCPEAAAYSTSCCA